MMTEKKLQIAIEKLHELFKLQLTQYERLGVFLERLEGLTERFPKKPEMPK